MDGIHGEIPPKKGILLPQWVLTLPLWFPKNTENTLKIKNILLEFPVHTFAGRLLFLYLPGMKRWLAFLLILSHVNTSMLLPQVPQEDVYDKHGEQIDDINSVVEWVLVKLGIDQTADDEDDDNGQHLRRANFLDCITPPAPQVIAVSLFHHNTQFIEYPTPMVLSPELDIIIPPPKFG